MSNSLKFIKLKGFVSKGDVRYEKPDISYQIFGKPLNEGPLVVVVHALTGNSDVAGEEKGWWKTIIGKSKLIDTEKYTVLAFNIPGNTYDGNIIEDYKCFTAGDIAQFFNESLEKLNVKEVYAAIGGSLGGCIIWEMLALKPKFFKYIIPIATDWKSTDWLIGISHAQDNILNNSKSPIHDARQMAMLFYRTQPSLQMKFNRTKTDDNSLFNIQSWLNHHGDKLQNRFSIHAYKLMNHLLTTVDITEGKGSFEQTLKTTTAGILQIAIDTDLMFPLHEAASTSKKLTDLNIENQLFVIDSIHGHDAFLIEFEQITKFLQSYF